MKKQVALLSCALMATTFVLGATSCGEDVSDLMTNVQKKTSLHTITALHKGDTLSTIDDFGNMIVETPSTNAYNPYTTYQLFNVRKNVLLSGASVTVPADLTPEIQATSFAAQSGIVRLTDGMYASSVTFMTRETSADSWDTEIKYTLYGNNGKVAENLQGNYNENKQVFTAKNGTRYYVNVKGDLVKEENRFATIFTYADMQNAKKVGEYYLMEPKDHVCKVFDLDGKYVRAVNINYALDIPEGVEDETMLWTVGENVFAQYSVVLPEDENKYDFIAEVGGELVKYDLVTKRYNIKKDKVKEISFDYYVDEASDEINGNVILYVQEIKDERVLDVDLVQSFDDSGKVAVDLQKIVPGAEYATPFGDHFILYANGTTYILQEDEIIAQLNDNNGGRMLANSLVFNMGDVVSIYGVDLQLKKTYENVVGVETVDEELLIRTETGVVLYNVKNHTEKVLCSYAKDQAIVVVNNLYIAVQTVGFDGKFNTNDDTYTIYFLYEGLQTITLSYFQMETFSIQTVESYTYYSDDQYINGDLFYIEQDSVRTYYYLETEQTL